MHHDQNITADIDRAISEGREHFGRLALAKKSLAALRPGSPNRIAAQELVDTIEAELARIGNRIGVSAGELAEMIREHAERPARGRDDRSAPVDDALTLHAAVIAADQRIARATVALTLANRELADARNAKFDAMEAYRAHCAKPLVRA